MSMRSGWYIMEPGGVMRPAIDFLEGAEWFETSCDKTIEEGGRIVKQDEFTLPFCWFLKSVNFAYRILGLRCRVRTHILVSTVFLGLDHGFGGVPMLFETMIFGGKHDMFQERYTSLQEAEEGHALALELVKK